MQLRRSVVVVALALVGATSWFSSAPAAERLDPSGTWTWVRELDGRLAQSVVKLVYRDGKLTGTYKREGRVVPISNAKFEKNEITFEADGKWNGEKVHGKFQGKMADDAINGTVEITIEDGALPLPWIAKRGVDFDDVIGTWTLVIVTQDGNTLKPLLKLSNVEGCLKAAYDSERLGQLDATEVKLDGSKLSWNISATRDGQPVKLNYHGKLAENSIKGTVDFAFAGNTRSIQFSGERTTPKPSGPSHADAEKDAKVPKIGAKPTNGKST